MKCKPTIPPCSPNEMDQTVKGPDGRQLGVIRARCNGFGPFRIWRTDGEFLGEVRDYVSALCRLTEKRKPHRIAASRQRSPTIRSLKPAIASACF